MDRGDGRHDLHCLCQHGGGTASSLRRGRLDHQMLRCVRHDANGGSLHHREERRHYVRRPMLSGRSQARNRAHHVRPDEAQRRHVRQRVGVHLERQRCRNLRRRHNQRHVSCLRKRRPDGQRNDGIHRRVLRPPADAARLRAAMDDHGQRRLLGHRQGRLHSRFVRRPEDHRGVIPGAHVGTRPTPTEHVHVRNRALSGVPDLRDLHSARALQARPGVHEQRSMYRPRWLQGRPLGLQGTPDASLPRKNHEGRKQADQANLHGTATLLPRPQDPLEGRESLSI